MILQLPLHAFPEAGGRQRDVRLRPVPGLHPLQGPALELRRDEGPPGGLDRRGRRAAAAVGPEGGGRRGLRRASTSTAPATPTTASRPRGPSRSVLGGAPGGRRATTAAAWSSTARLALRAAAAQTMSAAQRAALGRRAGPPVDLVYGDGVYGEETAPRTAPPFRWIGTDAKIDGRQPGARRRPASFEADRRGGAGLDDDHRARPGADRRALHATAGRGSGSRSPLPARRRRS